MGRLTPYDTGARMEPKVWPIRDEDDYGRVDFDNDEGGTTLTVLGTADRESGRSVLEVSRLDEEAEVTVDGDPVLVLAPSVLEGLRELVDFARRGWDDFCAQADETSDYTEEDVEAARARWASAEAAAALIPDAPMTGDEDEEGSG